MAEVNEFVVVLGAEIDPAQAERIASEIEFLVGGIDDGDGSSVFVSRVEIR